MSLKQGEREILNASRAGFATMQCLAGIDTNDYLLLRIKHFMGGNKKTGAVAGLVLVFLAGREQTSDYAQKCGENI
ncbi:hypothetical protein [Pantoea sp. WEP]|uniref:hypothetical protein n=1 Tax=Pantoea sp. WEP TaxID=3230025 RepID=UPI003566F9EB